MIKTPRTQHILNKQVVSQRKLAQHFESSLISRVTEGQVFKKSLFGCPIKNCRYCQRLKGYQDQKLDLKAEDSFRDYEEI